LKTINGIFVDIDKAFDAVNYEILANYIVMVFVVSHMNGS